MSGTAPLYAPGDEVFVYATRFGLVTRLEGWALSVLEIVFGEDADVAVQRMVAVFRNEDGDLDVAAPLCVTTSNSAADAWHLVAPDGRIVGGGPRRGRGSLSRRELEALRDEGTYASLAGSVAVHGLPNSVRRAPAAEPVRTATGSFTAARGGRYVWYTPDPKP